MKTTVWFKCKRKRAYNNPSKAERIIEKMELRGETNLGTYLCKYCGKWHVGHKTMKGGV